MSKERLEDKLVKFRQHLALGYVNMDILNQANEIHELVMEQAKRVQELEDIIYQDERQAVLEGMYEQNKRYRGALDKTLWYARECQDRNILMNPYHVENDIEKSLEESS